MSRSISLWLTFVLVASVSACNRPTLQEQVTEDSTFETTDGTERHWLDEEKKMQEMEEKGPDPSSQSGGSQLQPTAGITTGVITRQQLVPVIDGGLGRFLQNVRTEPDFHQGAFVGFRIVSLFPNNPKFASLDLQPGDTVTKINGMPIERPEQALAVWEGLRTADELIVNYQRGDEPRSMTFAIVDAL